MKSQSPYGVVFQPQTARAFLHGVNTVVNAVAPTLGPLGGVVASSAPDAKGKPELLDDGAVIARRLIALADPDADMGAMYTRHMLWRLGERSGDGIATAAIIFQTALAEGLRYIAAQGNAMRLRDALKHQLTFLLPLLEQQRIEPDPVQFKQIAEGICGDDGMAHRLAAIFPVIGADGALDIRTNNARSDYVEFIEGAYWKTEIFRTQAAPPSEMPNVHILVSNLSVTQPDEAVHLVRTALEAGTTHLVLVAAQVAEPVLGFFQNIRKPGRFEVVCIKTPGALITDQVAALQDLAILTGAQALHEAAGDSITAVQPSHFGQAERAWIARDTFGITGGAGTDEAQDAQLEHLRTALANNPQQREACYQRIGHFNGGAAVLVLGGDTLAEAQRRVTLAQRTAAVMRSVLRAGVVAGGGAALLELARQATAKPNIHDVETRAAQMILSRALSAPFERIISNAGHTPGPLKPHCGTTQAFDVIGGRVVNAVDAGLLDSLEILQDAVHTAISSAAQALTIDVLLHHRTPETSSEP